MKNIKRILLIVIFSLTVFTMPSIFAEEGFTTAFGARYRVVERVEDNQLAYGVKHFRDKAESSTSKTGVTESGLGDNRPIKPNQLYTQQVNVLEVPSDKQVRVVNWSITTNSKWTLNSVRTMAHDYEEKHPGWKVIGAINGDFFDIRANNPFPYRTSGASVSGGDYYKSNSGNTVGFTNDGSTNSLIGNEKVERTKNMQLALYDEDDKIIDNIKLEVEKRNELPGENETSIYFANWINLEDGAKKEIVPIEIPNHDNIYVVEDAEKALAVRHDDFYGRGVITSTEAKTLAEGEFAIVSNNQDVIEHLEKGKKIRVQFEYVGAYANVTDASGAGVTLIKNGEDVTDADKNRHPRTMIGKKADGTIVMAVIDGRRPQSGFYGANNEEMAALMKSYGCVDAYNLDGGGSSTLIIRDGSDFRVTNVPSDNRERSDANAILVVAYEPDIETDYKKTDSTLTLNVDMTYDAEEFDIKKKFVEINNVKEEIIDGVATFKQLDSNTDYKARFYIEDSNGQEYLLATEITYTTAKKLPFIKRCDFDITNNRLVVYVDFDDEDVAISRKSVFYEGKQAFLVGDSVSFVIDDDFDPENFEIELYFRFDLNDFHNYREVYFKDPTVNRFYTLIAYQNSNRIIKTNNIIK